MGCMRDSEAPGGGRRGVDAALGLLRGHAVTVGDAAAAVVVAGLSLWLPRSFDLLALPVAAAAALAAAVSRRRPAWALGLVWAAAVSQLLTSTAVFGLEAAAVLVGYRTARRGRPGTVWAAGLSIPIGAVLVIGFAVLHPQSLTGVTVVAELLRVSGAVDDVVTGRAGDLDPATAAAAYRVLQELLTNALKHGAPDGPIGVGRCWTPGGLTLRVTNDLAADGGPVTEGMGLHGCAAGSRRSVRASGRPPCTRQAGRHRSWPRRTSRC